MARLLAAFVLAGLLSGCVTSQGPFSQSSPHPSYAQRTQRAIQTADASRRARDITRFPVILGAAY